MTVLWFALALPLVAAEDTVSPAQLVTPAAQTGIDRGLQWLAAHEQADGSFGSGAYRGNVAVTALAGMAMIASGSPPGRGPFGGNVDRAIDYLLTRSGPGGFIMSAGAPSHGPMYGHGFATLFLAECHGMSPRVELRSRLAAAVQLIVSAQNREGGWRYWPHSQDADVSVTVCQVMALRAARNAGLHVPKETIDRATDYLRRAQNPDGGFVYMLDTRGESAFPRSAAAIVALYSAGIYEGPPIEKGLAYLEQFRPGGRETFIGPYFEYGHYYASLAMWQTGGNRWTQWYPAARDELLSKQRADGSWVSIFSPEYATAMCLLVLQTPNGLLPIFQR